MYRCQPQAKSHVYRSVLLGVSQRGAAGQPEPRPAPPPDTPSDAAGRGQCRAEAGRLTASVSQPVLVFVTLFVFF